MTRDCERAQSLIQPTPGASRQTGLNTVVARFLHRAYPCAATIPQIPRTNVEAREPMWPRCGRTIHLLDGTVTLAHFSVPAQDETMASIFGRDRSSSGVGRWMRPRLCRKRETPSRPLKVRVARRMAIPRRSGGTGSSVSLVRAGSDGSILLMTMTSIARSPSRCQAPNESFAARMLRHFSFKLESSPNWTISISGRSMTWVALSSGDGNHRNGQVICRMRIHALQHDRVTAIVEGRDVGIEDVEAHNASWSSSRFLRCSSIALCQGSNSGSSRRYPASYFQGAASAATVSSASFAPAFWRVRTCSASRSMASVMVAPPLSGRVKGRLPRLRDICCQRAA
jgi:hypothetical protein